MNARQIVALIIICVGVGYFLGKRSVSQTKTETQQTNTTKTVITKIKDKAGREKTITVIDSKTDTKAKTVQPTPVKSTKTNISAIVANDFNNHLPKPIYGVSFNREFIGPITIGAFGLTNGTAGVSIGFNF